jgi:hypothetical protein
MIRQAGREHLRLVFQSAEGARVHHTVAVALKRIAIAMRELRIPAPSPAIHGEPQMGER